jgi:hypothetical protein
VNLDHLNTWKDITLKLKAGFVFSIAIVAFMAWMALDKYVIVTEAEASATHQQMISWQLEDVRRQIENIELKKVETKYRSDLSPKAKDELVARYDIKLKQLRNHERCLQQGKIQCND